jgi:hypothetical protein
MRRHLHTLLSLSLLTLASLAPVSARASAVQTPSTEGKQASSAPAKQASSAHLTLTFKGTVREAVERIATQGHLSVVFTGKVDEPEELYLRDVSAEDALRLVAQAHKLNLTRQGNLWLLSPGAPAAATAQKQASKAAGAEEAQATAPEAAEDHEDEDTTKAADKSAAANVSKGEKSDESSDEDSDADEELVGVGAKTVNEGQTVKAAVAFGGSVDVLGHVSGDAVAFGGNIHLGPKAVVDGSVTSFGGRIIKDPGAQVHGAETVLGGPGVFSNLRHHPMRSLKPHVVVTPPGPGPVPAPEEPTQPRSAIASAMGGLVGLLVEFALCFGLGFLLLMFAPVRMKVIEGELLHDPVKNVLIGLLGLIALFVLMVFLTITLVGIPFSLALAFMFLMGVSMGFTAIALAVGERIPLLQGRKSQVGMLALGVAALVLVKLIPVVGALAFTLASLLSFGVVIRTRLGSTNHAPTPSPPAGPSLPPPVLTGP